MAAVAVAVRDVQMGGYTLLWGVPLISWLILAALLCPTIYVGDQAMDALVTGLEMAATRLQLDNIHYTLIGLSGALKCAPLSHSHSIAVALIPHQHELHLLYAVWHAAFVAVGIV
jgi:hypothetical protein